MIDSCLDNPAFAVGRMKIDRVSQVAEVRQATTMRTNSIFLRGFLFAAGRNLIALSLAAFRIGCPRFHVSLAEASFEEKSSP